VYPDTLQMRLIFTVSSWLERVAIPAFNRHPIAAAQLQD
jgi:hypothetical protein